MATFSMNWLSTLLSTVWIVTAHAQPLMNPQGMVMAPSPMVMRLGPQAPFGAPGPFFQPFLLVDIPPHSAAASAPPYNSMVNMRSNVLAQRAHMEGKQRSRRLLILQRQQEMHSMQKMQNRNQVRQMRLQQNRMNTMPMQAAVHNVNRQNVNRQNVNVARVNNFRPRNVPLAHSTNTVHHGGNRRGLAQQNRGLVRPNQGLVQPSQGLVQQSQGLVQQNRGIVQQNRGLAQQNQELAQQNRGFAQQSRGLAQQNNRFGSGTFSPNFGRSPGRQNRPTNNNIIVVERRLQHIQPAQRNQNIRQDQQVHDFQPFQDAHDTQAAHGGQARQMATDPMNLQTGQNERNIKGRGFHDVQAAETVERVQVPKRKTVSQPRNKRPNKNRSGRRRSRPINKMRMSGKTFDFSNKKGNRASRKGKTATTNIGKQNSAKKRNGASSNSKVTANKKQSTSNAKVVAIKTVSQASKNSDKELITPIEHAKQDKQSSSKSEFQTKNAKQPSESKKDKKNGVSEKTKTEEEQSDATKTTPVGTTTTDSVAKSNFASVPQAIKPFSSHVFGHVDSVLDGASKNSNPSDDENTPDLTAGTNLMDIAPNAPTNHAHGLNGASVMDLSQTKDFLPPELAGLGAVDVVTLGSIEFALLEQAIKLGQPISAGVLNSILGAVEASKLTPAEGHQASVDHGLHDINATNQQIDALETNKGLLESLGSGGLSQAGPALGVPHHAMHGIVGRVGESVGSIAMENSNNLQGMFTVQSGKDFPNIPASVSSIPSSIGKLLDKHSQRSQQHKHKT